MYALIPVRIITVIVMFSKQTVFESSYKTPLGANKHPIKHAESCDVPKLGKHLLPLSVAEPQNRPVKSAV